jgi:hypothetical protein
VVVEYCEALTRPMLLRNVPAWPGSPVYRRPGMKTLSSCAVVWSELTKWYQGMPVKSWPVVSGFAPEPVGMR